MAITINGAFLIARAVARGVPLGNLVTIGRQGLYAPKRAVNALLAQVGRQAGYPLATGDLGFPAKGEWADDLYRYFGAEHLTVLDGSPYEGAELIHDLNRALPPALAGKFDCLIDAGSLEHVFNVPEALGSYMKMVRVGGHVLLLDMPVTNLSGHGFYQFSPALFWQVFAPAYGFEVLEMSVCEVAPYSTHWRVANPAEAGRRVELVHGRPCHLNVLARKTGEFPGFSPMPVQEDYQQAWSGPTAAGAGPASRGSLSRLATLVARFMPRGYWKLTNARNYTRTLGAKTLGGAAAQTPYSRIGDEVGK